jgi:phage-related protein
VKEARFHPKARAILQGFPASVRREFGKAIFDLQKGENLSMPLSRPMPSVAVGAEELRIKDRAGVYRAFYFTKVADAVLIFHAFVKKTAKTPPHEIDLAQKRLREMLYEEN